MKTDFTKPITIQYFKDNLKSIGIILGTHGDEVVGLEVLNRIRSRVEKLQSSGTINFIIANPLAVSLGVRFINKNINTECFPWQN